MSRLLFIVFVFSCFSVVGQDWRDSLDLARKAYKQKEYAQALKHYQSIQKTVPDNIDLSDEMAQSAYKAREFETAEKIYQQSASSNHQHKADKFHNLGNSRMKKKDYEGAVDAYKESLRLNPNDDNTRYNLSEAIRQLKNQQKQEQEQQKDQNKQDQNNQNQNQNQNQDKDKDKGKESNQENKKNSADSEQNNQGQLPNKTVDRMLDKLMKDEIETKRKVNSSNNKNKAAKSGKDW